MQSGSLTGAPFVVLLLGFNVILERENMTWHHNRTKGGAVLDDLRDSRVVVGSSCACL